MTEVSQFAPFAALVVAGELVRPVVKGFDPFGDGDVFVGDGLVGDTGVDDGHGSGLVMDERRPDMGRIVFQ